MFRKRDNEPLRIYTATAKSGTSVIKIEACDCDIETIGEVGYANFTGRRGKGQSLHPTVAIIPLADYIITSE